MCLVRAPDQKGSAMNSPIIDCLPALVTEELDDG